MELYLQDIDNGVEDLSTLEIESEYYPVYLIYLYKNFDSYKEEELVGETSAEEKSRLMNDYLKKKQEMTAIKNDKNPIYKFV